MVDAALPDAPIAVALSGGADSAVCAWAVAASGRPVRAIVVDHRLPASANLVSAAEAVAERLSLGCEVVAVGPGRGDEGELRELRYAAVEAVAEPGEVLVTGHTADDQAETVLGNLIRGAGAGGLAGIPAQRGRWLRPLLEVTRAEVRAVAEELGLPFADDPDNVSTDLRRSRLRVEAIPYLEERFNPAVRGALRRAGRLAAEDDLVLEQRAAAVAASAGPDEARVAAAALTTVPPAVSSRVVRRMLRGVFAPYPGDARDVRAVLDVAAGVVARAGLSRGWLAEREGAAVVVHPDAPRAAPGPVELPSPGRVAFGRWTVSAEPLPRPPSPRPLGRWTALIDDVPGGLVVRVARPGETIPMGDGSKRVADALREAGVPARLRATWPVLERGGTMVWLVGARLAAGSAARTDAPVLMVHAEVVR